MAVSACPLFEMQLSGSAGAWSDITSDVRAVTPVAISYGIQGTGPLDRVAGTGTMKLQLDNGDKNSGGKLGYYSPDHANVRSGFALGDQMRFSVVYSGSTFYKFVGALDSVEPFPGKYRDRYSDCVAVDWMDEAASRKVRLAAVGINQRADQNVATLIGSMIKKPSASILATGQDTFPFSLDTALDESTTIYRELVKSSMSELGYLFVVGDRTTGGVLTFDDRHARPKTTSSTASLNDSMVSMRATRERARIFNIVKITTHPRELDAAASILFSLQSNPQVLAGASQVIYGRYTDPAGRGFSRVGGASMVTPASTTDFLAFSACDGTGTNLTANFLVAASYGGNSVRYAVTNNGGTNGYLTFLQARGIGIYDREPTVSELQDIPSQNSYGESLLGFDMPYQSSVLVGDDAANFLLSTNKDPATLIDEVVFVGNDSAAQMLAGLLVEPGDKVDITETVTGLSKSYFVNGCNIEVTKDKVFQFTWKLVPAEVTAYWILGVVGFSELDTTTRLAY